MSKELMSVEGMSMEELDVLQQQIMIKKVNSVVERLERMESNYIKAETKNQIKFGELENKIEDTVSIAVSSNRVRQPRYDYVNQTSFGSLFNVSISNTRVGKLLKVVGIAQPSKRKTMPYREFIPKLAKTRAGENFTTYEWHFTNCLGKIDSWLKDRDLYTEFYSIEHEKDMEVYIDRLFSRYV